MLTIERKKKAPSYAIFADVPIGTVYEDAVGNICIKITEARSFCYYVHDDEWRHSSENASAMVVPLKAKLVVEGVEENQ